MLAAPSAPDWIALTDEQLPVETATRWAATPASGAVVAFSGVVRDHSEGRPGVTGLTYEAYESEALRRLADVAAETRRRWPVVERLALLHRTGDLAVSDTSVVVVASAPHRPEAFEAARFAIDTLKETVPIWKREHWAEGSDWAECAHDVRPVQTAVGVALPSRAPEEAELAEPTMGTAVGVALPSRAPEEAELAESTMGASAGVGAGERGVR